jgi:hypothetical protein
MRGLLQVNTHGQWTRCPSPLPLYIHKQLKHIALLSFQPSRILSLNHQKPRSTVSPLLLLLHMNCQPSQEDPNFASPKGYMADSECGDLKSLNKHRIRNRVMGAANQPASPQAGSSQPDTTKCVENAAHPSMQKKQKWCVCDDFELYKWQCINLKWRI